jgi:hypothetical protein
VALPFTLKIIRQKKNYGNSNISPCNNIISQKSSKSSHLGQDQLNRSPQSAQASLSSTTMPTYVNPTGLWPEHTAVNTLKIQTTGILQLHQQAMTLSHKLQQTHTYPAFSIAGYI